MDGVIISTPNGQHFSLIEAALKKGKHVAVDKPTVIDAEEHRSWELCSKLVALAETKGCRFVTIAQRRCEGVYERLKRVIGDCGILCHVHYLMARNYRATERKKTDWENTFAGAGGGVLVQYGYHGIDTLLWLLPGYHVHSVSATTAKCGERNHTDVEDVATLVLVLTCGDQNVVVSLTASFLAPCDSIDEELYVYGDAGAVRLTRQVADRDTTPPRLSFQKHTDIDDIKFQPAYVGVITVDTDPPSPNFCGPLDDFLAGAGPGNRELRSSAASSVNTLAVIDAAYLSARRDGNVVCLRREGDTYWVPDTQNP